jgi:cation:H+ antiporter
MALLAFAGGLVILVVGAEALVRGASRLAAALRISPLVIGLTVVAFGTSAPEVAVSVTAAFRGQGDIAVANVVGSNIVNVLLILGGSALLAPLTVRAVALRRDIPLMIGISTLVPLVMWGGRVGRGEGIALVLGLVAWVFLLLRWSGAEPEEVREEYAQEFGAEPPRGSGALAVNALLVLVGLVGLALGARWMLAGAVEVARWAGLDERTIGLTLVAVGTSLPEVAASLMAAWRGERDIAVGNVVGSNIFNVLAVLGTAAALAPDGIRASQALLRFDVPVMLLAAFACLPLAWTGFRISRREGALLVSGYVAYTAVLLAMRG